MATPATFVLVGHCGADSYSISNAVRRAVPGAAVVSADEPGALDRQIKNGAVLLVNRVLDGGFHTDSGVELIESLASRQPKPRMLLVSNYADAQQAAVAAGALPGFGKSELGSARTSDQLRSLAAASQPAEAPQK